MPTDLLFLGDWFVDENWVTRRASRDVSSLEGGKHLAAHGVPGGTKVLSFCGAGRVARFLYWIDRFDRAGAHTGRQGLFNIYGLGLWAPSDTCRLLKLFHPAYGKALNPFTLVGGVEPEDRQRLNELDGLYLASLWSALKSRGLESTPRVCRVYTHDAADDHLVVDRRIDFEPLVHAPNSEPFDSTRLSTALGEVLGAKADSKQFEIYIGRFHDALKQHFEYAKLLAEPDRAEKLGTAIDQELPARTQVASEGPFKHVLVVDHERGALSDFLFDALATSKAVDDTTRWYILTKSPRCTWLKRFAKPSLGKIALLCYHPLASSRMPLPEAGAAVVETWFIDCAQRPNRLDGAARLTEDAWKALVHAEDRGEVLWTDDAFVLALHSGLQVAGAQRRGDRWVHEIVLADRAINKADEHLVGCASAFFARLAAHAIAHQPYDTWCAIAEARRQGRAYVENMVGHFRDLAQGRVGPLEGALAVGVSTSAPTQERSPAPIAPSDLGGWKRMRARTLSPGPPRALEIWRAMQDVPGYVAIDEGKRRSIRRLQCGIRSFMAAQRHGGQSYAAMITAKPASGKTALVKKLAISNGLLFEECNITQLVDRGALLHSLDRVANIQSATDQPLLVFVDEINAHVAGQPVYDVFLSVLEGGTFGTAGGMRRARPAVWLFAGTRPLLRRDDDGEVPEAHRASKESDFASRLNDCDISLDVDKAHIALELFYIAAAQLHARGVRQTTQGVLSYIWEKVQNDWGTARAVRRAIEILSNYPIGRPFGPRDLDPASIHDEGSTLHLEVAPEAYPLEAGESARP